MIISYRGFVWTGEFTQINQNRWDVVVTNTFDFIERSYTFNQNSQDIFHDGLEDMLPRIDAIMDA